MITSSSGKPGILKCSGTSRCPWEGGRKSWNRPFAERTFDAPVVGQIQVSPFGIVEIRLFRPMFITLKNFQSKSKFSLKRLLGYSLYLLVDLWLLAPEDTPLFS